MYRLNWVKPALAILLRIGPENARMDHLPTDETVPVVPVPAELANHPDYEIISRLGAGVMPVFLARNRHIGRHEVLRVIGPDIIGRPGVRDHFLREIRSVAKLRHPNIVAAYSGFRAGESLVFAMEYAEGLDLARLVKASGPLSIAQSCSFVRQAALGLQQAHRIGLVHRDLKPGNLMLTGKGNRAIVKVLDFGLAKASREEGALSVFGLAVPDVEAPMADQSRPAGQITTTPDFIAPEQIGNASKADIRGDIYSLGCTLYFLLSGRPPFEGATAHDVLQAQHSMNALPLNQARRDVPAELAALVAKAMSKNPADRFQAPADLAQALATFIKNRLTAKASPSAERGGTDETSPALELTAVAQAVSAGEETAPWSRLIDISDFDDDADHDDPDLRPRLSQPFRAAVAGSAVALIAIAVGLGIIMQRSGSNANVARNLTANASPKAVPTDTGSESKRQVEDKQTIARSGVPVATVERQPKSQTESKAGQPKQPARVATPEAKRNPAIARSPDTVAPVAMPGAGRLPAQPDFREIASFYASAPVVQARLFPDNQRLVYEISGTAPGLFVGNISNLKTPHKLESHSAAWRQLAFAADGRTALALNEDRTVSVWDLETQAASPLSSSLRCRNRPDFSRT